MIPKTGDAESEFAESSRSRVKMSTGERISPNNRDQSEIGGSNRQNSGKRYVRAPVGTLCLGQAASMGSLLLAGGEPGMRRCLPHAQVMLHQPSGGAQGQATDIAIVAKEILKTREKLNSIYVRHTGKKMADVEAVMDRDTYFTAGEALAFGVIDEVVTTREDEPGDAF